MTQVRIAPNTVDERILTASDIISQSWEKTHTGLGTFRVTIPFEPSIDSRFFDEILLEDSNSVLFRGFLLSIDSDEDRATTSLSGKGIAWELTNDERVVTYQDILAHNAIQDFWDNHTNFSATVTTPTANTSVTDSQVQEANTNSEFTNITTIGSNDPLAVQNDNVELLQSNYVFEGESGTANIDTNGDYSNGEASGMENGESASYTWTTDYDIPSGDFRIFARVIGTGTDAPDHEWVLDGNNIGTYSPSTANALTWSDVTDALGETNLSLSSGSHTLDINVTSSGTDTFNIDVVAFLDNRFNYNFDNTNDGSGGYLDGPELYPDAFTFAFNEVSQNLNITEADLNTTWDDTTNNQRIQLRLGSGTWFPNDGTENNTSSITTDFGTEDGRDITGRGRFSRYGSTTGQTPLTGINGQKIQSWEILIDGNDIIVFSDKTFEGSDFEILQRMHSLGDMRFSVDHQENSKPVNSFQVGDEPKTLPTLDIINKSRRKAVDNYANHVTVRGQRVSGTRLKATESNTTEINNFGKRHDDLIDPTLETQIAVDEEARAFLEEKLRELVLKGTLEVTPTDVRPGFTYPNPFDSSEDDVPLEEVRYSEQNGRLSGQLLFDFRAEALSEFIGGLRGGQSNTKRGF